MGETPWRPPRACDVYWAEFKHCKSLRNRFHHYYAYGTSPVCLQWKDDYEACREWESNHSPHAKEQEALEISFDDCQCTLRDGGTSRTVCAKC
ncbi:UPF0545 protein C22orf39 homolog isoform X2 [Hemibagrus wyckioides]|uniref:UPF0545 protein C22orf39 homolog isoform X2 n=1 Tax=Hemibagrus wyckioides TaxID=337641 RepID=UPI00266CB1E2|nr:UPF0545 protein C22orf39 homolog isoform X2 [Hemibagrus wyckioides]